MWWGKQSDTLGLINHFIFNKVEGTLGNRKSNENYIKT